MHIAHSLFVPFQNNQVIGSSRVASQSPEYHLWVFLMFHCSFLYTAVEKLLLHLYILSVMVFCLAFLDTDLMISYTIVIEHIKLEHFKSLK